MERHDTIRARMLRKWAQRRREAQGVQRWLTVVLVVVLLFVGLFAWTLAGRLGAAGRASYCRGNVRHLAKALTNYAADHDECLPPGGSNASQLLLPYVFGDPRRCPDLRPGEAFSYGILPEVGGRSIGAIATPPEQTPVIIETTFRHRYRGESWGAVGYLDGSAVVLTERQRRLLGRP